VPRRFKEASFAFIALISPAASQTTSEIKQELTSYTDLLLLQQGQKSCTRMGRFDCATNQQSVLPPVLRPIATWSGFNAQIWRDRENGEARLIFLGSNDASDWMTANIPQGLQRPTLQHNLLSPIMGQIAKRHYGVSSCAGFSLGFGNATLACANSTTNLPVTGANGARLNVMNASLVNEQLVTSYRTSNDRVSSFAVGPSVGRVINLPMAQGGALQAHSIDAVVAAATPRALQFERMTLSNRPEPRSSVAPGMGRPDCSIDYNRIGDLPPHCHERPTAERARGVQMVCLETYGQARQRARREGTGMPLQGFGQRTPDSQCYRPSYKFEDTACQALIYQANEGRISANDRRFMPCMEILRTSGLLPQ
jgi:hypothetical protein